VASHRLFRILVYGLVPPCEFAIRRGETLVPAGSEVLTVDTARKEDNSVLVDSMSADRRVKAVTEGEDVRMMANQCRPHALQKI
jgi:hypothetical protein